MINMEQFKGTKGELKTHPENDNLVICGNQMIAEFCCDKTHIHPEGGDMPTEEEMKANINLNKAAPELLETLQKYHDMATKVTMPTEQELNELALESQVVIHKALGHEKD